MNHQSFLKAERSRFFVNVPYFTEADKLENAFNTGDIPFPDPFWISINTLFKSPTRAGSFTQPTRIVTFPNFLVK